MSQPQPTENQTNNTNLTLSHLQILIRGLEVAQRKGAFSFEDSSLLAEPVRIVNELVRAANVNANNNSDSTNTTASNDAAASNDATTSSNGEVKTI